MNHTKKQFAFNVASGWMVQVVNACVGFVLLPYIIIQLGEAGYGIFELARSAIVFFMFLQLGMGPTLVRYFAKSIARNDKENIRKICSAAQLLLGGLGVLAAFICLTLIPFFLRFYEIPEDLVSESTWLLVCMAGSIFLNISLIVPQGMVLGLNRYELANGIEIFAQLLRMCLVFVLFELFHPSLLYVGISILSAAVWRYAALTGIAIKGLKSSAVFSAKSVCSKTFRSLLGFSSLNLMNSIAAAVALQSPALIIGKFLGQEAVAAFAPAMLISTAMAGILGQTAKPLVPMATKSVEGKDASALGNWALSMGRFIAFIGFGIILPLSIFGQEIMQLWVGQSLAWIWPIVVVMSTGVAVSQIQAANYFLALGGGNIKPTVYSQMVMAVVVFCGLLVGMAWFEWDLFDVALYIGLCIFLRNTLFLSYAYGRQFGYSYPQYLWSVYVVPVSLTALCVVIGWTFKKVWPPQTVLVLALEGIVVLGIYLVLCWLVLIPAQIKQKIISTIQLKFSTGSAF